MGPQNQPDYINAVVAIKTGINAYWTAWLHPKIELEQGVSVKTNAGDQEPWSRHRAAVMANEDRIQSA